MAPFGLYGTPNNPLCHGVSHVMVVYIYNNIKNNTIYNRHPFLTHTQIVSFLDGLRTYIGRGDRRNIPQPSLSLEPH